MLEDLIKRNFYGPAVFSTAFDDMLDEMFSTPAWFGKEKVSYPMNVVAIKKDGETVGCRLEYALAGFGKDEISVSLDGDTLTVEAEHNRKAAENEDYRHNGISYRKLSASYRLMDNADRESIESRFENGLLTVTIMLKNAEKKAQPSRRIEIQ